MKKLLGKTLLILVLVVGMGGCCVAPYCGGYPSGYGYGGVPAAFRGLQYYAVPSMGGGYGGGGSGFTLYGNGTNIIGGFGQIGGQFGR